METHEHGSDKVRRSKLNLIDLAGSERVGKTNSSGTLLREAKYINSSLFYLEVVITALHEKATIGRSHIPYRNSFMTSVLRSVTNLSPHCLTIFLSIYVILELWLDYLAGAGATVTHWAVIAKRP